MEYGICSLYGKKGPLVNHHYKCGSEATVPVCSKCNSILKRTSSLFEAWCAWFAEYPPLEIQKLYVLEKHKEKAFLSSKAVMQESSLIRKKGLLREFWKPFYCKIFPDKNIFVKDDTTRLTIPDLENMHTSLSLLNEFGDKFWPAECYPLPTCLIRYSYKHPSPHGWRIGECLILIPELKDRVSQVSTEGLSEDEISYVIGKMEESLRTCNYEVYEKAVGVYRDVCYLKEVLRGKKRRARDSPWGKTPRIEFLLSGINNWAGYSIWSYDQDCDEY